jgi:DNA-binding GntR family transcriptional regulator
MTVTKTAQSPADEQGELIKRIEEDIIFGRLAPGARLIEDNLIERYGASRHFVRQALVHLEHAGVVQRERHVGATVRSYSEDEVRQVYQVREMLTRHAALMIPLPAPESLIAELNTIQSEYIAHAERSDLRGIHDTNDAFHIALFAACGNPYLLSSLQDYMNITLPMRAKNLADPEGLRISILQHDLMISLLQNNDSWSLSQLCVDHMHRSKADYLQRIANRPAGIVSVIAPV